MTAQVIHQLEGIQIQHAQEAGVLAAEFFHLRLSRAFVQASGQAVDLRVAFVAVHFVLHVEDSSHPAYQNLGLKGLADIVDRTQLQCAGLRFLVLFRGEENDGDLALPALKLPQLFQRLKAIHIGHFHVQQNQIRRTVFVHTVQERMTRRHGADTHPVFSENMTRCFKIGSIGIRYDDPAWHGHFPFRSGIRRCVGYMIL